MLALVVVALLQAKDVRHAALAARFPGRAQTDSVIRRLERFFDRHPLCPADVARLVLLLLPDRRPREFILDRTNWKLGQQDVNILLLAVVWREVAIPLLFELLPHGGSSNTKTRHLLLDDVLCLLSCTQTRVLYADREFIGETWIDGLVRRGIPLCVLLRTDTTLDDWRADDWLARLNPEATSLGCEDVEVYGQPMNVVLTWTSDGKPFIVASNTGSVQTIQASYRRRFRIECLFRALKTKGFNLENTHMTLHDHVERLLCLLTIAYVWCVLVGVMQDTKRKAHGRRAWSVISLGLRALIRAFSQPGDQTACSGLRLVALLMPSHTTL
ncbi:IS4 family transposase [Deinococcus cavernae]|uniref:IS4 family transposase n=1 Tax=Deinococcus cavernae TaxID=2320857 RepID=A0A418UZR2_9DEIO|nr:IS4 family transposase [Deinococcus cavernae]RJF73343.1 IS4 family transposase [Deinococcus cavernae]